MQRVCKQNVLLAATAATALLFTGCGESKVSQCNKIVKVANQAVTVGQEFGKNPQPKKGSKALTEAASKVDKIANDLKAVEVKDEKLQGFQTRFLKLYQDTSTGMKNTAKALDKKDIPGANRLLASLKKSASDETALVKEINNYCNGS
ncbi:hypothetical protein Cylst_0143 [Cylindrospermum stagnale PCC 7417]|uniref:Lipoprotein n=1 Tax=Cylindrospermum stagnale PCC 7417 TaxID=56107 RepID=K9WQ62_9NOST|nr:hypothetical protein [Cylindrospermum stagnale]AFZ22520.1 hypothetical protein Cylst_0143 [Cylindrospermum stagnale PCC 7417]